MKTKNFALQSHLFEENLAEIRKHANFSISRTRSATATKFGPFVEILVHSQNFSSVLWVYFFSTEINRFQMALSNLYSYIMFHYSLAWFGKTLHLFIWFLVQLLNKIPAYTEGKFAGVFPRAIDQKWHTFTFAEGTLPKRPTKGSPSVRQNSTSTYCSTRKWKNALIRRPSSNSVLLPAMTESRKTSCPILKS